MEDIRKYSELLTKVIARLEEIWEIGEGDLNIEIRNIQDKVIGKISGGKTERVK